MRAIKNLEEFIKVYKIATKLKWSREQLSEAIGMQVDSIRRKVGKVKDEYGILLNNLPLNDAPLTQDMIATFERELKALEAKTFGVKGSSKKYLITSAQNATPIHKGFFAACKTYCAENNAEFVVIPYRYKNPTSLWTVNNKDQEWWSDVLQPYLIDTQLHLRENLTVLGEIKVQPTKAEPLSGLEAFSGRKSVIVGHAKVQLKSVATLDGNPKLLLSTGAVTVPNYTDSAAGRKGEFHHSIAAVVVEIDDDDNFFIRHVHASNSSGNFYDLDKMYSGTGVSSGHRVEALITGDTHAEFMDEEVEEATYHAADSIASILKPKRVVLHDVLDFYRRNHHARGNDILAYGKHKYGRDNVQDELQLTVDFIDRITRSGQEIIITKSNHDEAFDRWLRESDPKSDPENAELYHYMKYHQYKSVKSTDTGFESFDPFQFWCLNPENGIGLSSTKSTTFLRRDESLRICGIEVGYHGDVGINGSRGDVKSLSRLSDKIIIGHSHTPAIYDSAYQVGLSCKKNLDYKKGPSSWMHTHCVIYPDGKRTLLHIINGRWKA